MFEGIPTRTSTVLDIFHSVNAHGFLYLHHDALYFQPRRLQYSDRTIYFPINVFSHVLLESRTTKRAKVFEFRSVSQIFAILRHLFLCLRAGHAA